MVKDQIPAQFGRVKGEGIILQVKHPAV